MRQKTRPIRAAVTFLAVILILVPASLPSLDVPRSVPRMDWGDLPSTVQERLVSTFGEYVSEESAGDGRSFSFASKVRFLDRPAGTERQVFVKAVPSSHERQFQLCEGEMAIQAMLSRRGAPIPHTFSNWTSNHVSGEAWRVMVYEVVANSHSPGNPWTEREFRQIGDAVLDLIPYLTAPEPIPRIESYVPGAWAWSDLQGWKLLPPRLEPFIDVLDDLHNYLPAAIDGDHVIHADMAGSNILLNSDRTWFIDWDPKLSQPWVMWVSLAAEAHAHGVDVNRIFAEHPLTGNVPPEHITAFLSGNASNNFYRSHGKTEGGRDPRLADVRRRYAIASLDLALRRLSLETPAGVKDWRPEHRQPTQRQIFRARFRRPETVRSVSRASFLLNAWRLGDIGFPIRAVAHDVDLTVAEEGAMVVSAATATAFAALPEHGLHQFPATARDPVASAGIYDMFPQASGFAFRDGATVVVRTRLGDPNQVSFRALRHYEWPRETVAAHLATMEDNFGPLVKAVTVERGIPGIDDASEIGRRELAEPGFGWTPRREWRRSVTDSLSEAELEGFYVTRAFLTKPTGMPFTDFYAATREIFDGACVVSPIPDESAVRIMPFADGSGHRILKGRGIAEMADYFGFAPENVVVYGDNLNDESMFDTAGYSVAVWNAILALRLKADRVVPGMAADGVARHLNHDVLPAARAAHSRSDWTGTDAREVLGRRRVFT